MRLAALFSGGKDSSLALHRVLSPRDNSGEPKSGYEVKYLLNIVSENEDSFMFHKQDFGLLEAQADRLGIEMVSIGTKGEKEKELDDLRELIGGVKDKVDGIVVGGIASSYQGERVRKICDEMGLEFMAPLLDIKPEDLWDELLSDGFEVVIIKITCDGIGKEWLGRGIDKCALSELRALSEKYKFRLDFEGGEAESCVLNMPGYSSKIEIDFKVESEGEFRHFMRDVKVK